MTKIHVRYQIQIKPIRRSREIQNPKKPLVKKSKVQEESQFSVVPLQITQHVNPSAENAERTGENAAEKEDKGSFHTRRASLSGNAISSATFPLLSPARRLPVKYHREPEATKKRRIFARLRKGIPWQAERANYQKNRAVITVTFSRSQRNCTPRPREIAYQPRIKLGLSNSCVRAPS